jgi:hypothetical protein
MSTAAYSVYLQLPSIHNPRTCHAVVIRDPPNMVSKYRMLQKEFYNFESLYKFIQRTCTGNGRLHEEEGTVHSFLSKGSKHVHLWAVTNMFQEDTWIFAVPDPAVHPYH